MVEENKLEISRDEWITIGIITSFAFLWMLLIIPHLMISGWFTKIIPPLQYILYNVGFLMLIFVVFGTPMSFLIKHKVKTTGVIKGGAASTLFLIMLDLWEPPFIVAPDTGKLLLTNMESLLGTSIDYNMYWIYSKLLPNSVNSFIDFLFFGRLSMIFVLIYFFTPILLAFIMALLLKPGMFRKMWDGVAEHF